MATLNQPNDPNNPNQQNPNVPISGTGGGGQPTGVSGGSAAPTSQVSQNLAPQQNQGYTDVSAYLNANQQGGQQLGSQVAQNLTGLYGQTKAGIDTSAQGAQQEAQKGYTPTNTDLINQVTANPLQASQDQIKGFQTQLNQTYQGPQSWNDLGTQQGLVSQAQQKANLINTPGGTNQLVGQVEGDKTSQGINALDTLLLQGNPGAVQQVKTASSPFTTLNDYINQQNQAVMGSIGGAQQAVQQGREQALQAGTGAIQNLNTAVNQETAAKQAAAKAAQDQIQASFKGVYSGAANDTPTSITGYGGQQVPWYNSTNYTVNQFSPEVLQSLGITPEQGQALQQALTQAGTSQYMTGHNFGAASPTSQIDLSQWLNLQDPNQAITAGTVATPEQYQTASKLQELFGGSTPQDLAINPALSSLAGTAPQTLNKFDYQGATDYANQVAQAERQAGQQMANQLTSSADLAHANSKQHGWSSVLPKLVSGLKNPANYNMVTAIGKPTIQAAKTGKMAHGGLVEDYLDKEGK